MEECWVRGEGRSTQKFEAFIHLATMANTQDHYEHLSIIDSVNDAELTNPDPPKGVT